MKKLLLTAVAAAIGVSAQAAPTLYGRVNLSVDQVGNVGFGGYDSTTLNSNASRIGVKGQENLIIDKLDVVYQAEWEVSTDGTDDTASTTTTTTGVINNTDPTKNTFTSSSTSTLKKVDLGQRNRFIGLKFKDIGTLKAGRYDSYFKTAAGNNQDIFNDHTYLDITNIMAGEDRLGNVIGFETDKNLLSDFGALQFNVMGQLGETTTMPTKGATGKDDKRNSVDGVSASVLYELPDYGLSAALAGNFGIPSKYAAIGASNIYSDGFRVTAGFDATKAGLDGLMFGALYQSVQPTDNLTAYGSSKTNYAGLKEDAMVVTLGYAIPDSNFKVKGEYAQAKTSADKGLTTDRKIDQYGVGVDYNFNKKTRAYAVLAQQKRDWLKDNNKQTVGGLGIEYSF